MKQRIAHFSLLVDEYDRALSFYRDTLGFTLLEDTDLGGGKRWVRVAPPGGETALLIARASDEAQRAAIGRQGGGRVWLFLYTDDFWRDYARYRSLGVEFEEAPREEAYGTVAVFRDPYGNRWDLLEPGCPRQTQAK